MRRWIFPLLAAALAAPTQAQGPVAGSYRIGPRDQIQIHVEDVQELNREVTVAEDGTISLPLIGTVEAQGQTEMQLEERLQSLLVSLGLRQASVTVSVTTFRSRPVSILGAVAQPGNQYVPGRATLLQVIMEAGGLAPSHGREIIVRRRAENGLSDELRIAVADLLDGGTLKYNLPIFAGDLVNVPPARDLTIHLIGELNAPGTVSFEASRPVTLLTAVARAGGLTDNASRRIRIQRRTPSGDRREIVVDYRRVLNNKEPDVPLEDGDLVIVKESFF